MNNSLPNDLPNSGNGTPPSFGADFNPHTNPIDPNNPYQSYTPPESSENAHYSTYSEVAQHKLRDEHGRFIHTEHSNSNPAPQISSTPPNIPNNSNNSPVQVIHGDSNSSKPSDDAPLFEAKVNNPFSSFFNWIKRLIKNEGINIKIKPLTAIAMMVALTGGGGIIGGIVGYAFPHSSPILHRSVIYQGNLQRTPSGFILTLPNSDLYTLKPKMESHTNFQSLTNGPALVKGNLTPENFVIEVSEIIPLGVNTPTPATNSAQPSL